MPEYNHDKNEHNAIIITKYTIFQLGAGFFFFLFKIQPYFDEAKARKFLRACTCEWGKECWRFAEKYV